LLAKIDDALGIQIEPQLKVEYIEK